MKKKNEPRKITFKFEDFREKTSRFVKNRFFRLKNHGVNGFDQFLEQRLDTWRNYELNIAVVGSSGVGKSTFINSFRGLTPSEQGAASVGVVETTNQLTTYEHPDFPKLKLWDLPGSFFFFRKSFFDSRHCFSGVGTPNYPKESYFNEIHFERYDFFLILSRTRFTGKFFLDDFSTCEKKKIP